MRLNKYIAACGICSRRDADKLIALGRIKVNGQLPSPGEDIKDTDIVFLDEQELIKKETHTYIAYYKPVGITCTERDPHAKKTVIEDLGLSSRVTYAGRLDKDSEGLLIMTDDGELINAIMRGKNAHEKEYEVTVDKPLTNDFIHKMSSGVYLRELDKTTRKCTLNKLSDYSFDIVLTQGLNRQIRRMCGELGYIVRKLKRVRIMNLNLSDMNIEPGEYRYLTASETKNLCKLAGVKYDQSLI